MGIKALHYAEKVPGGLGALDQLASCEDPRLAVPLFGKQLKNPLGVAAGLDKDAEAFSALFALGFGHVEVGTVTPKPQPGNPKPRVWRLPAQRAVINALGFPSEGADVVLCRVGGDARRREREREHQILGINVGKNKDTPLTDARSDYCQLIERFFDAASYFVVNISSPNTPGLRELQFGDYLKDLLTAVVQTNRATGEKRGQSGRPLLVKLAPDVDDEALEQIAETAVAAGVDGLVATNTTISRQAVPTAFKQHPGGLSGLPLLRRSQQVIRRLYRAVGKRVPIIGVGGVATAEHVVEHMRAGASLVQLYTGLIYGGPFLASQILRDLTQLADRKGWCSITELVGQDE
jgi:dihydroorotate dehydrogenase